MSARTPVLVILLLSTIALIVVTELACQRIPQHAGTGNLGFAAISNVINDTLRRDLDQNVEYREGKYKFARARLYQPKAWMFQTSLRSLNAVISQPSRLVQYRILMTHMTPSFVIEIYANCCLYNSR